MAWESTWMKAKHVVTEELLENLHSILSNKIRQNGGSYKAKIGAEGGIMEALGIPNEHHEEWYGTIWNALKEVRSRYGIESRSLGRGGNEYFFSVKHEDQGADQNHINLLQQIKFLVGKVENERDALQTIKIIQSMLSSIE